MSDCRGSSPAQLPESNINSFGQNPDRYENFSSFDDQNVNSDSECSIIRNEFVFDFLNCVNCNSEPDSTSNNASTNLPTLNVSNVTTNVPTLNVSNITTNVPTLNVSNVTTNVPNLNVSNVTTNVPTLNVSNVTTNVPTLNVSNVTTNVPTLNNAVLDSSTNVPILNNSVLTNVPIFIDSVSTNVPTLHNSVSTNVPTLANFISNNIPTNVSTLNDYESNNVPTNVSTLNNFVSNNLPTNVPILNNFVSTNVPTLNDSVSTNVPTIVPTLHDYVPTNVSTNVPTLNNFVSILDNSVTNTSQTLKIGSINVCGLCAKLKTPDFYDYVNNYDILFMTETKLDDLDECNIDGYTLFRKNRGICKKKSGGTGFFIRNILLNNLKVQENRSFKKRIRKEHLQFYNFVDFHVPNELLLCTLSNLSSTDSTINELLLGVTYIAPETSSYVNNNIFEEIELCLSNFSCENVLLTGDYNARTGNLKDFIDGNENDFSGDVRMTDSMEALHIEQNRFNMDKTFNAFGRNLIDMCASQSLLILNGRVGGDKGVGKFTCKNASVVDYFIASPNVFTLIADFDVMEFDHCLSDVHCPLYVILNCYCNRPTLGTVTIDVNNPTHNDRQAEEKFIWNPEKENVFLENIDLNDVNLLRDCMLDKLDNINDVEQTDVDSITDSFCKLLKDSAIKCNMNKKPSEKRKTQAVRRPKTCPWEDRESNNARISYRRACRNYRVRKSDVNSAVKNRTYRFYKKIINKKYNCYVANTRKRIRSLKTKDPKRFWKIVNGSSKERKEELSLISKDVLAEHFEKISNIDDDELFESVLDENQIYMVNQQLNAVISEEEILKAIKRLNNNKACGFDRIINEFLKNSAEKLLPNLTILFNIVLISEKVPTSWSLGYITPLYKGKGDKSNPDNYRGITVLSCLGKLFTSVLNQRINDFLETCNLLGNEQAGFRSNNSTYDHLFALHCLVDLYLQKKKKLFCLFVDYKKAFDTVQRSLMWEKLFKTGVNGHVLSVIKDMYQKARSCIKLPDGTMSRFFLSNIGLRQGENLSPVLFSIFLNDLKDFLLLNVHDLSLPKNMAQDYCIDKIDMYMKLFLLLYADDTAILTENEKDMKLAINMLEHYCNIWGLKINVSKTKIIVFSRGKIRNLPQLYFQNELIGIEFDYKYLGVIFNYNNKFTKGIKERVTIANRAMFSLLKKCRNLFLPIDIQIELFQKCINPVLLYGCEVWGYQDVSKCTKLQLKFLKIILGLKSSTPTCMVLGEVGAYPIEIDIKCRMLGFWYRLRQDVVNNKNKISALLLSLISNQAEISGFTSGWLNFIYTSLDNLGLSHLRNQTHLSVNQFKRLVKQRCQDQYLQTWSEAVQNSSICKNYRMYKTKFKFETYNIELPFKLRKAFLKFRASNNNLPVNRDRYLNVPRHERLCTLCDQNDIGDEYHYILTCKYPPIARERERLIKRYYYVRPNVLKFNELMSCTKIKSLTKLAQFVKFIIENV